jgi:hypothetical protein
MENTNQNTAKKTPCVGYTAKQPERCLLCGSRSIIRKGRRKKILEIVQLWQCKSCHRVFTPGSGSLRNKTYPLRVVLDAVTLYNQGYSLSETAIKIKSRYGHNLPASTLSSWLAEHKNIMTYSRLRRKGRAMFSPAQSIRSFKLYHKQVYSFAYHRPKIELLRQSREHSHFGKLADFLESVPKICPHVLFRESSRASQISSDFIDRSKLIVVEKENFATRSAALVIPTVGDNRLRHESLQRFMLANDSVTVAVEIPVWIREEEIAEIEEEHGIQLFLENDSGEVKQHPITGHIDFLQVRNGAVHILDYKPDARTNKPIAQLTIYALALSRLTGIPLFDFKCAWFNENQYCEFFPRKILASKKRKKGKGKVETSGVKPDTSSARYRKICAPCQTIPKPANAQTVLIDRINKWRSNLSPDSRHGF